MIIGIDHGDNPVVSQAVVEILADRRQELGRDPGPAVLIASRMDGLFHFVLDRIMDERSTDCQRQLFKSFCQEYEASLVRLQRKNDELERLGAEMTAVNNALNLKVQRLTMALKNQSALMKVQGEQLENANAALAVLLEKLSIDGRQCSAEILDEQDQASRDMPATEPRTMSGDEVRKTLAGQAASNSLPFQPDCRGTGNGNGLSERECAVARLIAEGRSCQQVAEILGITPRSVHSHCYNIRKKLQISREVRLKTFLAQQL